MASFSKLSVWPVGYFRVFSSWLLKNRRDVAARIQVINAEIVRIGFVKVYYLSTTESDGTRRVTEERVGFSVTPNSNLERLVQAYIAHGGNPLDISPFMQPDSTEVVDVSASGAVTPVETYPHGGVVAPKSANYNDPLAGENKSGYGTYTGGFMDWGRYYPARLGGRITPKDLQIAKTMRQVRDWANMEIKTLQDIEWRIVKQMDLREQLTQERDDLLMQAFGGVLDGLPSFDATRFNPELRVQAVVQALYDLLYDKETDSFRSSPEVAFLDFTFQDTSDEQTRAALGG